MRILLSLLLFASACLHPSPALAVVTSSTRSVEINGANQNVFTVPYHFSEASALKVTKVLISSGVGVLLTINTDYSVTLPIGQISGKVTTTAPVAATHKLRIERVTPLTQTTAFTGAYVPSIHQKAFDKLTMAIQDNPGEGGGGGGGVALSNATPTNVNRSAGAAGIDSTAARADHKHDISTAAPTTTLTLGASAAEGSATSLARSDHTHAIDAAIVGDVQPVGLAAAAGSDASVARGDHVHAITAPTINSALSTGNIDANGRVAVRVNSTGTPSVRRRLNFIAGANVTLTPSDDSANEEVDLTIASSGGGGGGLGDGDYGDITVSGTSTVLTVDNDVVTNAKAANMANATIKCRTTAGTGDPEDCTAAQATALLNVATTSVKGLAPTLSNVASQYWDGTGNWSTPAGGTPSDATPGAVSTTGAAGAATAYSRGDHVHAITGSTINSAVTGVGLSVTGASNTAGVTGTGGATNAAGVSGQGAGTGAGVTGTGGATGRGGDFTGGASGAVGVRGTGTNGNAGVTGAGHGAGAGVTGTGGATGAGGVFTGGSTSGSGIEATSATGIAAFFNTTSGAGLQANGGSTGQGGSFYGGGASGRALWVEADLTSPVNAALRIVPQDTQPSGPNSVGDAYVTAAGVLRMCTVAGTPGTWVDVGAGTTNSTVSLFGDVSGSGTGSFATAINNDAVGSAEIINGSVALADMANLATDTVIGRATAGTGVPEAITVTAAGRALIDDADATAQRTTLGLGTLATQSGTFSGTSSGTNTGDQTITLTGDVTGSGTGSFAATIANDAVTNAKAANMAANTVKCRITGSTGDPEDCTAANIRTIISAVSGSATAYLDGTGNFSTPAGGGGGALWSKDYMADQFVPVGTSWPTTAMADLETYNLVNVIAFDPTTSQGRGLEIVLPTGATTITLTIDAAAAASGFTSNNGIVMALDCRQQYSTGSFTQQAATAVTITDNATIQRKTFDFTVSGLSATAGTVLLCELERLTANGSDTMTQDWRVAHVGVEVN